MNLGPWEIAAIIILVVLLFGAKKLPDLARSVGRSMRIFKSEVKEMNNDDAQARPQQGQIAGPQPSDDEFWNAPQNQPNYGQQQAPQPQQGYNQQQPQNPGIQPNNQQYPQNPQQGYPQDPQNPQYPQNPNNPQQ